MGLIDLFLRPGFLKPSFARGIHPPQHKETGRTPIRRMPFASRLTVPLSQHLGKPARAMVVAGQEVLRGELIAVVAAKQSKPSQQLQIRITMLRSSESEMRLKSAAVNRCRFAR